jgi:hypothetical protein
LSVIGAFLLRLKRKSTPHLLIVKRRTAIVFTSRDKSKGDATENREFTRETVVTSKYSFGE